MFNEVAATPQGTPKSGKKVTEAEAKKGLEAYMDELCADNKVKHPHTSTPSAFSQSKDPLAAGSPARKAMIDSVVKDMKANGAISS